MNEKHAIDLSTSEGRGQAGGRRVFLAAVGQLLVVCLVVLIGAVVVSAGDATTAPDVEPVNGAGAYGLFRLAGGEPGVNDKGDTHWESAGSYSAIRLALSETQATTTGAESAVTGPDVFDENGANTSAWFEVEAEWYLAQHGPESFTTTVASQAPNSCAEQQDDPVFGASSAAEAEFYESQCSARGLALLIGGSGAGRR